MKGRLLYFLPIILIIFSCEEKKLQQDHPIDLFANERQEGKAYIMKPQECFDGSDMVVSSSNIKLIDKSSGRGKSIFIYRVNEGKVLKTTRDSIVVFPFNFLSNQQLMFKNNSESYIYLKKLEGYRFIAKEMDLKYQWLKAAPVYQVKKEN
ncbi:hypothetical protein QFZ37_001920 [Chryseobacterium ginsenosidimutans]|uniref:hypothetical protein n=1 Tax=Chryseobacterium ginsenosidimutans TaxID=687846 RepID=UPI00277D6C24|nr:hypothetical protein [Chryseobacterium ginsenosidimutans]MDQ0593551.1 hypothetical protein [Chryseobacterium ginsenosidimutans]